MPAPKFKIKGLKPNETLPTKSGYIVAKDEKGTPALVDPNSPSELSQLRVNRPDEMTKILGSSGRKKKKGY